eukprot:1194528-Prorocentrum_minimum.AAC.2
MLDFRSPLPRALALAAFSLQTRLRRSDDDHVDAKPEGGQDQQSIALQVLYAHLEGACPSAPRFSYPPSWLSPSSFTGVLAGTFSSLAYRTSKRLARSAEARTRRLHLPNNPPSWLCAPSREVLARRSGARRRKRPPHWS